MSYMIKLRRMAHIDIIDAQRWYEKQKNGLGSSYYQSVKERINLISDNPYIYPERYKSIICAPLNGFPYMIYYLIEEDKKQVIILAVLHTRRNPKMLEERK